MNIGRTTGNVQPFSEASRAEKTVTADTLSAQSAGGNTGAAGGDDVAHLSQAASLISQTLALPDVRMDKVGQVQQALAEGSYSVDSSDVADRMISTMLGS